jgi:hypothetical protein
MATQESSPVISALVDLHGSEQNLLAVLSGNTLPLGVNEREFTVELELKKTETVVGLDLLGSKSLAFQCAGFRSARIVGPFTISVVAAPSASASLFLGTIVVALAPVSWGNPGTPGGVLHSPNRVILGVGSTGAPPSASLVLPPGYRDNVVIAQPAGHRPAIHAVGFFKGYEKITLLITGKVVLSSMTQLAPVGWTYTPAATAQ